jgi:4-hydroxymandelate synthase
MSTLNACWDASRLSRQIYTRSGSLNFEGIDHLELYVSSVEEAARWLCTGYGFHEAGRAGPEIGLEGRRKVLLQQGHVYLVLTEAASARDEVAGYVELHGDGVKDIALRTPSAEESFHEAVLRGARPISEPHVYEGPRGRLVRATVASPVGDLVHSFIERHGEDFWPGLFSPEPAPARAGLLSVDHVALCLLPGTLESTVQSFEQQLGLHVSHVEDVETAYGGMNSKVVQDRSRRVQFPMMEPRVDKPPGQIDNFLKWHQGPGVQHLAFLSQDILGTVRLLREHQVPLLDSPRDYYERLPARVGQVDEALEDLRANHVLVDREGEGYLLQVFTRSQHPRRTLFFEIIQRKAATGFGAANVRALYQSVEQEMMRAARPT